MCAIAAQLHSLHKGSVVLKSAVFYTIVDLLENNVFFLFKPNSMQHIISKYKLYIGLVFLLIF